MLISSHNSWYILDVDLFSENTDQTIT